MHIWVGSYSVTEWVFFLKILNSACAASSLPTSSHLCRCHSHLLESSLKPQLGFCLQALMTLHPLLPLHQAAAQCPTPWTIFTAPPSPAPVPPGRWHFLVIFSSKQPYPSSLAAPSNDGRAAGEQQQCYLHISLWSTPSNISFAKNLDSGWAAGVLDDCLFCVNCYLCFWGLAPPVHLNSSNIPRRTLKWQSHKGKDQVFCVYSVQWFPQLQLLNTTAVQTK